MTTKTGAFILMGEIELLSPLLIGSGKDEYSDNDVITDNDGVPFIPATSFVGVLKHYIKKHSDKDTYKYFWGFSEGDTGQQSALICSDLFPVKPEDVKIINRDGIKINNKTGVIVEGAKYDYQLIDTGANFNMRLEVKYNDDNKETCAQQLATIKKVLEDQHIRIGAKTNSGFGKIKLANSNIYHFDFRKKTHIINWLNN